MRRAVLLDREDLERLGSEALRHRLHHLVLHLGRLVEQASERAVGDHERPHRRGGSHRRRARLARNERNLAEEVTRAESVDLAPVLPDVGGPLEQHEELTPRMALASHLLAVAQVDLVGEHREVLQLRLRQAREQRHLADQIDLLVMAESHRPSLEWVQLPDKTVRPYRSYPAVVTRLSSQKRRPSVSQLRLLLVAASAVAALVVPGAVGAGGTVAQPLIATV